MPPIAGEPKLTLPGPCFLQYSTNSLAVLDRQALVHGEHVGDLAEQRDRREGGRRVVRHLLVEELVGDGGADRAEQQRVAVGRRLGDQLRADIAAGAALVLDHDIGAPGVLQMLGGDAAQQVGRAGGRERHDHADRLAGIGLRPACRAISGAAIAPAATVRRPKFFAMAIFSLCSDYIGRRRGDNVTAPLTGYANRVSVRAGKTISFKVSSSGPGPFNAALVRIICGDPNPAGRGTDARGPFRAVRQPLPLEGPACLAGLLRHRRGRGGRCHAAGAFGRSPDLADPAGRRAADRDLAPRRQDRRGLRAGADARGHDARGRRRQGRGRQGPARPHLVSRLGERRCEHRHAAGRPAAA